MSKIDDYEFKGLPQQIIDFKDDVRDLINNGKYQNTITTGTPTFYAGTGELAVYLGADSGTLYVRTGASWTPIVSFRSLA